MKKKLLVLLFLLTLVTLTGFLVLQNIGKSNAHTSEASNFVLSSPFLEIKETTKDTFVFFNGLFINASHSPVYVESEVLGIKTQKPADMEDLRGLTRDYCPYYNLISQYDWNIESACKIMMCESSGDSSAYNLNHRTKDNSHGLFQINTYGSLKSERPSREWLLVPENNISYAYKIYIQEGRRFGTTRGWYNCSKAEGIW